MPKFTYKGKNIYGDLTEGVYDAPSEQGVMDMLKSRNFYVLEVKPLIERRDILDLDSYRKIPTKELMLFCKHFGVILKAGIPVLHALYMVENQTENKAMKKVISDIMKEIQMGSGLTQAVRNKSDKLPALMIYMIEAGEASGTLDKTLDSLYKHYEKSYNTQNKLKSAMRYPIIVLIVAVIITTFLMIVVVPTFTKLFENNSMELPGVTKALVAISGFFRNYSLITALFIAGAFLLYKLYTLTPSGRLKTDRLKFKIPIVKDYVTRSISARFSRTMSTLMFSGVGITEGLDITSRVLGNKYAAESVQNVRRQVIAGKGLFVPFKDTKLFPEMLENMIQMGENAGTLEAMLENAAVIYEEEIDTNATKITDMIQPAMIIFLGGIIGFIILGVALPLFSLY